MSLKNKPSRWERERGSGGAISSRYEQITPDTASRYLENNVVKRPLRQRIVDGLTAAIKAGEWDCTHQGIALDKYGRLVDGQHRMWAVILSGLAIHCMVSRGVEPSIWIDRGIGRTSRDRLILSSKDSVTPLEAKTAKVLARYFSTDLENAWKVNATAIRNYTPAVRGRTSHRDAPVLVAAAVLYDGGFECLKQWARKERRITVAPWRSPTRLTSLVAYLRASCRGVDGA